MSRAERRRARQRRNRAAVGAASAVVVLSVGALGASGWRVAFVDPSTSRALDSGELAIGVPTGAAEGGAVEVRALESGVSRETPERATAPELVLSVPSIGYTAPLGLELEAGPMLVSEVAPGAGGRAVIAVPFDVGGLFPLDEITLGRQRWRVWRVGTVDELEPAGDRIELVLYTSTAVTDARPFVMASLIGD